MMASDRFDRLPRRPGYSATVFAVLLALTPCATAQPHEDPYRRLYCWQQNGQRSCSDTLPADAIDRARVEIDSRTGLRRAEIERAPSIDERAALAAAAAQRRLDQAAEQTRKRTDQAMLMSYRNEQELRRVFDERAAILDNNVRTARYNVTSLRQDLITLLRGAGERDLGGQTLPRELADEIRQRHAQLLGQQQQQVGFEQQRQRLQLDIAQVVQRYRAMRAVSLVTTTPDDG